MIFHGQLPREEAFALMQKSTYFIMVSDHETFGMVYIEAMLAGCITIASKGGGVDGVIFDGENGYLSSQGDVTELISTLNRIKSTENSGLCELRARAVRTAFAYSDSNVAKKYMNDVISW